jgi:hypothetical protein
MMVLKSNSGSPLVHAWLAFAVLLSASGVAGCAAGYVQWTGVFGQVNELYRSYVTNPISEMIGFMVPQAWFTVPGWLPDYLVLCAGIFVLVNTTWRDNMGRTLIADAFRDSGPVGAPIFLFFTFILTPVVLPFVLFIYDSLNYEGKTQVRTQLTYYALAMGVVAAMAIANVVLAT